MTNKERTSKLDMQRLTYTAILLALLVFFMLVAKPLLIPLAFGLLFTLMFMPIAQFFERLIKYRVAAIVLTFLTVFIPVIGLFVAFGFQFVRLLEGIPAIGEQMEAGIYDLLGFLQERWGLGVTEIRTWIRDNVGTLIETPLNVVTASLTLSTTFLAGSALSLIYCFFLLLYRTSFRNFFLIQFGPETRPEARQLLYELQRVTREYLYGLVIVILILGVLNGTGLLIIGIRYAYFWGFLAALLAIIPYIGTTLGGILPFLYAIATTTTFWQPAAVVALYFSIQQIEGNFITPQVVGSSVKVNPLVAIIALVAGGLIWGISGLILAIPAVAAIRVVFNHFSYLEPVGLLLSDHLYSHSEIFEERFDHTRHRLFTLFGRKNRK